MKTVKWTFILTAAALLALGLGGVAYAYHSGGVAECTGCHSMHSPAAAGSKLLIGVDQTSTCLSCHEHAGDTGPSSYHISTAAADMPAGTAPLQRTPGGDFGWLKKTYTFDVRGTATTEQGHTHGHNIVSATFGYGVDPVNATSPGGTFPSDQLACSSCHDPHGKFRRLVDGTIGTGGAPIVSSGSYHNSPAPAADKAVGVYRLLAGKDYSPAAGILFPGNPAAKVNSSYNRKEDLKQTRTVYGHATTGNHASWGNWCATCHANMHSNGGANYVHKIDEPLGATIAANYNAYVKSGVMTGDGSQAFTSLVPFIENSDDYTVLAGKAKIDDSDLNGPTAADRVACLSCHRAHASGWPFALRWNMEYEFIVYNGVWPGTNNATPPSGSVHRGRTEQETAGAYYDRPATQFASYQRVLCNKCHAKD